MQAFVTQCIDSDPCGCGCVRAYLQVDSADVTSAFARRGIRELATRISDWRDDLAGATSRASNVLTHLNDSWSYRSKDQNPGPAGILKSSQIVCYIPQTECRCCLNCWALAADLAYIEPNGKIRRGAMFSRVLAAFNKGDKNAVDVYPAQNESKENGMNMSLDGAIHTWLEQWLPGNVDQASMDPGTLILDAPSRKFVWEELKQEWEAMGRTVPSYNTFIKSMKAHYNIKINKHKKFSQCQVCALYKGLWAKSRMESFAVRQVIKDLRKAHLDRQYSQRMCYYCNRELSYSQPWKYCSLIVDAMTDSKTSTPLMNREVKGFLPAAYKSQLYGCLVHGPEGFFGYTVCSLKGARVTVEVVHRTLMKMAQTRKVWPSVFTLQLDNTTSDCKNHTVMAYLAWLEATGVFEIARLSFLPVGHTHEDIDGQFGLLMRHMFRQHKVVMTIEQVHKHIRDCFQKDRRKWLREDMPSQLDKHFYLEAINQTVYVEHLWNTFDWTRFLLQEHHPQGRAFATISYIAQLADPDVYRPHVFEFTIDHEVVVMNVKHWADDQEYWNESPFPLWNRIPDINDLEPAPIDLTKQLQEMHQGLRWCNEWYVKTGLRCHEKEPRGMCPRCDKTQCTCIKCRRCEQLDIVQQYLAYHGALDVSVADKLAWSAHFDALNQECVDATLPALSLMELPQCIRQSVKLPSIQAQIDALPAMMKQAPKGLKCKLAVMGLGPKRFKNLMKDAQVTEPQQRSNSLTINMVIGGCRSPKGVLEFAILQNDGEGRWVTFKELRDYEDACDEEPRSKWFGSAMEFNEVLVQEHSKRCYAARMVDYQSESSVWMLDFPDQSDNPVLGTSECSHEVQHVDLEELTFKVQSRSPEVHHKTTPCTRLAVTTNGQVCEVTLPGCYVFIARLDAYARPGQQKPVLGGESSGHHRFWVSRSHFGLKFVLKKLKPLMGLVQGQPVDIDVLQRSTLSYACSTHKFAWCRTLEDERLHDLTQEETSGTQVGSTEFQEFLRTKLKGGSMDRAQALLEQGKRPPTARRGGRTVRTTTEPMPSTSHSESSSEEGSDTTCGLGDSSDESLPESPCPARRVSQRPQRHKNSL